MGRSISSSPPASRTALVAVVQNLLVRSFGLVIVSFLVLGGVLSYRSISTQRTAQLAAVERIGRGTVASLARLASVPLQFDDLVELEKLVAETKDVGQEFRYAAILSARGQVVVANPPGYEPPSMGALIPSAITTTSRNVSGQSIQHFVAPVKVEEGEDHAVHLGLDISPTIKAVATNRNQSAFITLLMAIVAALIIYWFGRSILERVGLLSGRVEKTVQDLRESGSQLLRVATETETRSTEEAAAVTHTRRTVQDLLKASDEIAASARTVLQSAEKNAAASTTISRHIANLSGRASKITDISDTIRQIADKTDILALNASLEGTKAGEAGRGIALVGGELRRLAETVMDAVREIKSLASDITGLCDNAVLATEEGQRVSQHTREISEQITTITDQQRDGTAQVSMGMDEFQKLTRRAVEGARHAKTTANELVLTAEELSRILQGSRSFDADSPMISSVGDGRNE